MTWPAPKRNPSPMEGQLVSRRAWLTGTAASLLFPGCIVESIPVGSVDLVWGTQGTGPGTLRKPRAAVFDPQDRLYLVDMTARIQVFDIQGKYLHGWSTPTHAQGRPCGLGYHRAGLILVADTHYSRVLFYTPEGQLQEDKTLGGTRGVRPGEFACVSDVADDSQGCLYVADFSDTDRIQKFSPEGKWLREWGGSGTKPGEFLRPQCLVVDAQDRLWVADANNHRIQVFDSEGKLEACWGKQGSGPGQLSYPYGLALDGQGFVYVCEYGNQRIQKLSEQGEFVAFWGGPGEQPGELDNPWTIVRDSQGRLYVIDSENHRVQRITFA